MTKETRKGDQTTLGVESELDRSTWETWNDNLGANVTWHLNHYIFLEKGILRDWYETIGE